MIDISVNGLKKFFGDFELLKNITFDIQEGEKVGLIGTNGAGKTTLMKILSALYANGNASDPSLFDDGTAHINKSKRVGLIDQIPVYPIEYSVNDVLLTAFSHIDELSKEIELTAARMADDHSSELLRHYGDLQLKFELLGGYERSYMLEKVANGLGLDASIRQRPFCKLSGGEQTRVNLARVMLEKTDILFLDEPTNHLDIEAIEWLGEYLAGYKGTILMISHDRYFLDQVVDRIIEIDAGVSSDYDGNYSYYAVEKERRYTEQLLLWEAQDAEKKRLEEMARRYKSWATEKMVKRALTIEKKAAKITVGDRPRRAKKMTASINEKTFYADEALKFRDLRKSFGERTVVDGVTQLIGGNERVAIYGPNGCGKTTLLKMLIGDLTPDDGDVTFGMQVKWAYLPQFVTFDNMDRSILDTVLYTLPLSTQAARNRLGAFRFTGEDVYKPLTALSGGELSRLKLCILMNDELNMLILDEPTNHLDLASREWIEEVLEEFSGIILFVSHDRYFVSRFATRVWEMRDGKLKDYKCDFEQYRIRKKREEESAASISYATKPKEEKTVGQKKKSERRNLPRLIENTKKDIEKLEEAIASLEEKIGENSTDYEALSELLAEKDIKENELLEKYALLDELESESNES